MKRAINVAAALFSLSLGFSACQKQDAVPSLSSDASVRAGQSTKENTFYGPQTSVGGGKARSFITITHEGMPVEYGIEMSAKSMYGLPTDPTNHEAGTYYLPLHQKVDDVTPFSFIMLNWNPQGHEPERIYGVPHFDFHFYFNFSMEQQMSIMPGAAMETPPPAGYLPGDYISPAPGIPMMGKHWLDKFASELPPTFRPFDKTFIYGSYAGKVIFYEPMITRKFLMSGVSSTMPIKQPQYFSPNNTWYPTAYKIYTDPKSGNIIISLSDFVWR